MLGHVKDKSESTSFHWLAPPRTTSRDQVSCGYLELIFPQIGHVRLYYMKGSKRSQ
jgi:hypothetical protein